MLFKYAARHFLLITLISSVTSKSVSADLVRDKKRML